MATTRRKMHTWALADDRHKVNGVAVVGSVQMSPDTNYPYVARGRRETAQTDHIIQLNLSRDEARKLVEDWVSMGLFGRHGRVITTPPGNVSP